MEHGCPVCNGLVSLDVRCPRCSEMMKDNGMLENYYGPYSPYDDVDLYELPACWQDAEAAPCTHVMSCPACGQTSCLAVPLVIMG